MVVATVAAGGGVGGGGINGRVRGDGSGSEGCGGGGPDAGGGWLVVGDDVLWCCLIVVLVEASVAALELVLGSVLVGVVVAPVRTIVALVSEKIRRGYRTASSQRRRKRRDKESSGTSSITKTGQVLRSSVKL